MTFREAAIQVLKNNNNTPMSASEIWENAENDNLVKTKGKTPSASMFTILLMHSNNSVTCRKGKSFFTIVDENPHKFKIIEEENYIEEQEEIIEDDKLIYECVLDDGDLLRIYNNDGTLEYQKVNCDVGYTYFILDPQFDKVKIGRETKMGDRLKNFLTSNPRLEHMFSFPNALNEKYFHRKFDSLHSEREWFFHGKGIKDFINKEEIKREDAIKSYNLYLESKEQEKKFLSHF